MDALFPLLLVALGALTIGFVLLNLHDDTETDEDWAEGKKQALCQYNRLIELMQSTSFQHVENYDVMMQSGESAYTWTIQMFLVVYKTTYHVSFDARILNNSNDIEIAEEIMMVIPGPGVNATYRQDFDRRKADKVVSDFYKSLNSNREN